MFQIKIVDHFDAAHHLPNFPGKCQQVHGHTFLVTLILEGSVLKDGILVDFGEVKSWLKSILDNRFDHRDLNDVLEMPTAELIAKMIYDTIKIVFPMLKSVSVKEGEGGEASYIE